jgi:hypothetical protein
VQEGSPLFDLIRFCEVFVTRTEELLPIKASRKVREAPGQAEGEELAHWLNSELETPRQKKQQERVTAILRLLQESVDVQNAIGSKDAVRLYAAARPVYERIAEVLSSYSYTPDIRLTWQGTLLSVPPWKLPRLFDYDDYHGVWAITHVASVGRIDCLRQCVGCKKWLFAKKEAQTTCGEGRCRARKYRKNLTEQELVKRREAAQKRYVQNKLKQGKGRTQ